LIETTVRHTHAPNEVRYVGDLLLVGFGSQNNGQTPRSFAKVDPTVVEENFEMFHNDPALVGTIMRPLAADGGKPACVDAEFEIEDWEVNAGRVKTIPVGAE
jgi:hypothetical protein